VVRLVVNVVLLAGLFAGAVAYAGTRLGAWDPIPPPPVPVAAAGPKAKQAEGAAAQTRSQPASKHTFNPAKKRWLGKLNRFCLAAGREAAHFGVPQTLSEAEALLADVVAHNARWNERFAALTPPREERQRYRRLLALFEKDENLLARMLRALRRGDFDEYYRANERLESVGARESDLLADIGAADCTYSPLAAY
jgi:hypothetical protein